MYNLNGYIQALKDGEAGARAPAALALGQIGKPAVAELKKGNCLAHRLVRSITIRRTSDLGM